MKILFVDATCPKPYDPVVLATQPLGGTEATVVRVAEELRRRGHEVLVKQHNRTDNIPGYGAFGTEFSPTHVIVLRAPLALYQARKQFPAAKLYLWCHDVFAGKGWDKGFQAMVDTQAVPVLVSEWHKSQMYDAMGQYGFKGSIPSRRIYNPVDEDLKPNGTQVDTNKLVFFSSPHKGLEHTLSVFDKFQNFDELKDMKLYIANPGYYPNHESEGLRNVINLGALSHSEIIDHVRSSLAVLHLNKVFLETFGLVHAEANAVGTPFLSARLGATPELADHPSEMVDVSDVQEVIKRITMWAKSGRPKVRGRADFRISAIGREWEGFLKV